MRYRLLLFTLLFFCLLSCNKRFQDRGAGDMALITILGNGASGTSPSGSYAINGTEWDKTSKTLSIAVVPKEFMSSPTKIDVLYLSALYGALENGASPEEAFAFERMEERMAPLRNQYARYHESLIERPQDRYFSTFIQAYISGMPSITANDILFGQAAGTDLSAWFTFRDKNIVNVFGEDYQMEERADLYDSFQTASEYFIQNKMMPQVLYVCIENMPDDITYTGRVVGDDIVKVNISIPVRFERYWEWCKALYSNPEAKEDILNKTIRIEIPLVRK